MVEPTLPTLDVVNRDIKSTSRNDPIFCYYSTYGVYRKCAKGFCRSSYGCWEIWSQRKRMTLFFQSNFTQKSVENKNYRFKLNDRDQSTMKTDENDHKQLLTFIFINSIENPPLILGFYVWFLITISVKFLDFGWGVLFYQHLIM